MVVQIMHMNSNGGILIRINRCACNSIHNESYFTFFRTTFCGVSIWWTKLDVGLWNWTVSFTNGDVKYTVNFIWIGFLWLNLESRYVLPVLKSESKQRMMLNRMQEVQLDKNVKLLYSPWVMMLKSSENDAEINLSTTLIWLRFHRVAWSALTRIWPRSV